MTSLQIRKMTCAAMLLALAVLMPKVAGLIPEIGKTLNLMHIPVLLCGFLCGWPWGLAVGGAAPLLSFLHNGMPKLYPDATVMSFELAAYGCAAGLLYRLLRRKKGGIYIALILAMIAGRLVYGIVYFFLLKLGLAAIGEALPAYVWARTVLKPWPGIALQIVVVPVLVRALERAGQIMNDGMEKK